MPLFDIDKIRNNVNSRVIIKMPGNIIIETFLKEDFSMSGSNSFSNDDDGGDSASGVVNTVLEASNAFMGTDYSNMIIKSVNQTISKWTGSEIPKFELPVIFVAIKNGEDVRKNVKELFKAVFPSEINFITIKAPLNYTTTSKGTATNTCSISIGKWFFAPGQIITDVTFTFSKQTDKNGIPIFAEGSISFHPFRLISASEFIKYFM